MVKGAYILNNRESIVSLLTSKQVVEANSFNIIYKENPMMAKLMLDKFKDFLTDNYFTVIERQTLMLQFLQEQQNIEITKEIINFLKNTEFYNDYTCMILEWTYNNSDHIINESLKEYDATGLSSYNMYSSAINSDNDNDNLLDTLMNLNSIYLYGDTDEI